MILYCTCYTPGRYAELARRLVQSGKKVGVDVLAVKVRDLGSWEKNTHHKARFLANLKVEPRCTAVVWVDADAVFVRKPTAFDAAGDLFDIAVYRHVPGKVSGAGTAWEGQGKVFNGTLYLRRSPLARRVLSEWVKENRRHPSRFDQVNLASVLSRVDPSRLRRLPREYCWIERLMRPTSQGAHPVIVHEASRLDRKKAPARALKAIGQAPPDPSWGTPSGPSTQSHVPDGPEVAWSGHFYDLSGYAKANRETLFRVANSVRVSARRAPNPEPVLVDDYTRRRLDPYFGTEVSAKAPLLRFYVPQKEVSKGERIIFTMMETADRVHRGMVSLINRNYSQLWTPTRWNRDTFKASGVTIPISVIPLGVDPAIYRPRRGTLPKARLLTTRRIGTTEIPRGYKYLTVCQPTFRKGLGFLVSSFLAAFPSGGDRCLVIYTGVHDGEPLLYPDLDDPATKKARIYHISGRLSEHQMSSLYCGADAYVSTSLGEGFNLPLFEAVACGLPAIVPNHTSHSECAETGAFMFPVEGSARYPEGDSVCEWYAGMRFAKYGAISMEALVSVLRGKPAKWHGRSSFIRSWFTWDRTAGEMVGKLT